MPNATDDFQEIIRKLKQIKDMASAYCKQIPNLPEEEEGKLDELFKSFDKLIKRAEQSRKIDSAIFVNVQSFFDIIKKYLPSELLILYEKVMPCTDSSEEKLRLTQNYLYLQKIKCAFILSEIIWYFLKMPKLEFLEDEKNQEMESILASLDEVIKSSDEDTFSFQVIPAIIKARLLIINIYGSSLKKDSRCEDFQEKRKNLDSIFNKFNIASDQIKGISLKVDNYISQSDENKKNKIKKSMPDMAKKLKNFLCSCIRQNLVEPSSVDNPLLQQTNNPNKNWIQRFFSAIGNFLRFIFCCRNVQADDFDYVPVSTACGELLSDSKKNRVYPTSTSPVPISNGFLYPTSDPSSPSTSGSSYEFTSQRESDVDRKKQVEKEEENVSRPMSPC